MSPRRYLASFLAVAAIMLGWIVALNVALDATGVLTALDVKRIVPNEVEVINGARGWYPVSTANREGKALNVRWYKPDVVALGSSNVATYFDTHHPALKRWSARPAFNFGLAGLTAFELEQALRHVTALKTPRLAIVALEFYMFNAQRWSDAGWTLDNFPLAYQPTYRAELVKLALPKLLSWSGPLEKLQQLVRHVSAKELAEAADSRRRLQDIDRIQIAALYPSGTPFRFVDNKGRSSIEALKQLIVLAQRHGIELRLMISPHHARHYEIIRALGLWPTYTQWLHQLAAVADAANVGKSCDHRVEILLFGEYGSLNRDLQFRTAAESPTGWAIFTRFDDSFHYNHETARALLGHLLERDACRDEGPPSTLTGATVTDYVAQAERERANFAEHHPDEPADAVATVASMRR